MQNSTTGKSDRTLIKRESIAAMNCLGQWEAVTNDQRAVFIEIYRHKLRIVFSGVGENVFVAREYSKSNDFDYELEITKDKLTTSQLITILEEENIISKIKEEDENDNSVD